MTRGLARELGRDNIRVNAVAPSAVITEGTRRFFANKLDKALDVVKSGQAVQRNLQPSDLSGTVSGYGGRYVGIRHRTDDLCRWRHGDELSKQTARRTSHVDMRRYRNRRVATIS